MTLHINTDRATTVQEFAERQHECDQQDVLDTGVKRRRHRTQQRPRRLDVQRHRQLPGGDISISGRVHRGQHRLHRQHSPPRGQLVENRIAARMLGQDRRPALKRRASHRQSQRLTGPTLSPRGVEIVHQYPPGHPIDSDVVNHHHQLGRRRHPHRAEHPPRRGIQAAPSRHQRLIRDRGNRPNAPACIHATRWPHKQ
ncbi:hypothetical protein MSIMFI_05612 [Mycobacterium simulans]|nr:hypothetical protein MSIMFI_05612 [Mycobacterium simulans]